MINEYCQQIAFSLYIVVSYNFFVSLRQLIVYQFDLDTIISRLIEKMELEDTSNKGCAIRIKDYRKRLCYIVLLQASRVC